jgi:3-hydroxyisobutyrate dehydrogenase-like beta-hydroxyacid dehydrogenase
MSAIARKRIGLLHPGAMGASVGAAAKLNGAEVLWASEGRSPESRRRAEEQGFVDAASLSSLSERSDAIVSLCPPDAAEAVADATLSAGFRGLYVDANAISPMRARRIAAKCAAAGAEFVDGSVIGPPAWKPGTRLWLSGERAAEVASWFADGPLVAESLGAEAGRASALKMCYAALSKGESALLAAILAVAEARGVRGVLERQWEEDEAGFSATAARRVSRSAAKAWRYFGEMEEIADTFSDAGLPWEFHSGAADVYRRLGLFKNQVDAPLEAILRELLEGGVE